ncbi:MAG TPA: RagB/SusD family nutrient uptake outer membrane protein [Flavitalea sp.]|nr:RagB/SusD family nutrient uptake outer membrane protein [Flavitalea sp.]
MKLLRFFKTALALMSVCVLGVTCTKLDVKVYSVLANEDFWKTPEEIAAGKAPAYQALTGVGPDHSGFWIQSMTADEMVTPTRGGDWGDGGAWGKPYFHTQLADDNFVNGAWSDIFAGVGKCNFIIYTLENLNPAPVTLEKDLAEIRAVRSYFFSVGLDLFGNIPYVTNFKVDPTTVVNIPRAQVFDSIEADLKAVLPLLTEETGLSTYGKMTKWFAYAILAKMYVNAEVYTGTPRWADCVTMCNNIIQSGKFSLSPNYFDNFGVNLPTPENLMVIPYDKNFIGGQYTTVSTIMSNNAYSFGITTNYGNNGMSVTRDFYKNFDTTSVYYSQMVNGFVNTYRTFNDQRTGQILVGQQYVAGIPYPPYKDILFNSTNTAPAGDPWDPSSSAIKLYDQQSHLPLAYYDTMVQFSNSSDYFRLAGLRNIKYYPQPGPTGDYMSNQQPLSRYADVLLMKGEALLRSGTSLDEALASVNEVRRRAYSGSTAHDWTMADLTLPNLLAERGREMAWELVRRTDVIRFGTFGNAKTYPPKPADADDHFELLPIPVAQHLTNPNLTQNPGYSW